MRATPILVSRHPFPEVYLHCVPRTLLVFSVHSKLEVICTPVGATVHQLRDIVVVSDHLLELVLILLQINGHIYIPCHSSLNFAQDFFVSRGEIDVWFVCEGRCAER